MRKFTLRQNHFNESEISPSMAGGGNHFKSWSFWLFLYYKIFGKGVQLNLIDWGISKLIAVQLSIAHEVPVEDTSKGDIKSRYCFMISGASIPNPHLELWCSLLKDMVCSVYLKC
jgi:hypothetical protein